MTADTARAAVAIDDSGILFLPSAKGLESEAAGYIVVDCYGNERPFNLSLLASGILAAGIEMPDAYTVALDVHRHLIEHHLTRIDSADLVVLAADRMAETLPRAKAELYLRWNRARRFGRPLVVALSGTYGIGKSTVATQLAIRLGINQVVATDTVREVLRTTVSEGLLPEMHHSILDARERQEETYTRQAEAVTRACAAIARRCIRDRKSVLFEGAHLLPGELSTALRGGSDNPIVIERMLYSSDVAVVRLGGGSERSAARRDNATRALQKTMRDLAADAGVREVELQSVESLALNVVNEYVDGSLD